MRLPPPARRYSPISVIAATFEIVSRPNCSSIAAMSSRSRSKSSFPVLDVVAPNRLLAPLVGPVVRELQIDAEILPLDHGDDFLQGVAIFAADAHYVSLDRGLSFLLRVLDQLHNLSRFFNWNALLQRYFLLYGAPSGRLQRHVGQAFQRHAAFDQLRLEDVVDRFHFEFVGGVQHDRIVA